MMTDHDLLEAIDEYDLFLDPDEDPSSTAVLSQDSASGSQQNGWRAAKRKREDNGSGSEDSRVAELEAQIHRLKRANKQLQVEKKFFESRALALEPTLQPSQVHTHDIEVDADAKLTDWTTEPIEVEGVEFSVQIKDPNSKGGRRSPHFGYPSPSSRAGPVKFTPMVRIAAHPETPLSVLFLVTVMQRNRVKRDAVCCSSQMQVFMDRAGYMSGKEKTFKPTADLNNSKASIRLTIVVQKLERISDGTVDGDMSAVPVVVHGKEFRVSKAYLSQWSHYFRVYFDAPMAEKKEGVFPVKDAEITTDDFEEMLMVILPTQKPVTVENFETLLKLAGRFEMPDLRRKVELFLIDFERHSLNKAKLFVLATDKFDLPFVQATLLHRWSDPELLKSEMLTSYFYGNLEPITKNLINQLLAEGSIVNFNVKFEPKPKAEPQTIDLCSPEGFEFEDEEDPDE